MVKIKVLVENSKEKKHFKNTHGLALHIDFKNYKILLDVGPNDTFIKNGEKLRIKFDEIDRLVLSHNHIDHTGGLDSFVKINDKAKIYLMDSITNKYYTKFLGFFDTGHPTVRRKCTAVAPLDRP